MSRGARTWVVTALVVLGCLGIVGGAVALVRGHPPVPDPTIDRGGDRGGGRSEQEPVPGPSPDTARYDAVVPLYQVGVTDEGVHLYREEFASLARGDDLLTEAASRVLDGTSNDPRHGRTVPYDSVRVEVDDGTATVRVRGDVDRVRPGQPETAAIPQAIVYSLTEILGSDVPVAFDVNDGAHDTLLGADVSRPLARDEDLQAPVQITSPTYGSAAGSVSDDDGGPATTLVEGRVRPGPQSVAWVAEGPDGDASGTAEVGAGGWFSFDVPTRTGYYTIVASVRTADGGQSRDVQLFSVG